MGCLKALGNSFSWVVMFLVFVQVYLWITTPANQKLIFETSTKVWVTTRDYVDANPMIFVVGLTALLFIAIVCD